MPRVKLDEGEVDNNYFTSPKTNLEFIDAGCAGLNCTLGGGWPLGRISNVVGDFSTGKTLLAIEACANFIKQYQNGKIWYREAEAAFDKSYAAAIGMPINKVSFVEDDELDFFTVEDFFEDLNRQLDNLDKNCPGLYILDSLDALSDRGELKRDFDEGSYSMQKAKAMHKIMRMCTQRISSSNTHLMIVSQEKDKIGVTFGKKTTRSGGRALDFFSSQILWLSHLKNLTREINKVKQPIGIRVKAKCEKNKIGLSFRQCDFTIRFAHGIDRLYSNLDWLEEVDRTDDVLDCNLASYKRKLSSLSDEDYWKESDRIDKEVVRIWGEIESSFIEDNRSKQI